MHFSLNLEQFSFGEGLGNDYAVAQPQPNVRSYAWRDYGNRVGAWRLLELAETYQLPFAALINSDLYDYCPELVGAFSARGDEIVAHGRTNSERQIDMTAEEELECIAEVTKAIVQREGAKPQGWLAPYVCQNHATLDLLKQCGYDYMMDWPLDDQPIWFRTDHGPILSIPYAHDLNDSVEVVTRRTSSQVFCENLIDQFDEMLSESERRPLVMAIVMHSFVLGQPHRLRRFRKVIEHILRHREKIWLARPRDIFNFIASLPEGVVPGR